MKLKEAQKLIEQSHDRFLKVFLSSPAAMGICTVKEGRFINVNRRCVEFFMMPKMTGGEAVRLLRVDNKTKHIPILFLTAVTANMPQGAEDRGINVDGQFYPAVAKPFKSEHLLFMIKKLIGDS